MEISEEKDTSNRPNLSPFHQQKLKGWQPIINTNNLYLSFFGIGFIFILIGSGLVYYSYQVAEISIDYTNCENINGQKCSDQLAENNSTWYYQSCTCTINITIPQDIPGPAYIYYGLTHFFQNHRRYVKSRDDSQLKGLDVNGDLNYDCEPYRYENSTNKIAYAPCGAIANSIFNDTFQLDYIVNNSLQRVPWSNKGIAWKSETDVRFGTPTNWLNTVKPINWPHTAAERSSSAYKGDEDLLVWLRTAALPNFKKLHRIVSNTEAPFLKGLPKGRYVLNINYSYPVTAFQGTKSFIISATNYMGGRNPTMGFAYLAVGTIYFSLAVVFLFINAFVARRRQNERWLMSSQTHTNGCSNQNYCAMEDGDHSECVNQGTSDGIHGLA